MNIFRATLWVQSGYTMITAIWPLIDIKSFMQVTGYKEEVWLVKTVGALLIPIALTLGSFLFLRGNKWQAIILGSTTAIAFATIDFYYALNDVIHNVYLVDGAIELLFLTCWMSIAFNHRARG